MNILRGLTWGYSYSYGKQDATSASEVPRLQQAGSQEAVQYPESGLATVSKTGGAEETDGRISFQGGATDAGDWQGVDVSAPFVDAGRALSGVSSYIGEARF